MDEKPHYSDEELERHEAECEEVFGENWPEVQSLLSGFRRNGIYLIDLHPRNIDFGGVA